MRLRRSPDVVNKRCYSKPNDFRIWRIASFRCHATIRRPSAALRILAAVRPARLWVHGLIAVHEFRMGFAHLTLMDTRTSLVVYDLWFDDDVSLAAE
jgi:hypothetical protein